MARMMANLLEMETARANREDARERRREQQPPVALVKIAKFQEGTYDIAAFLDSFEVVAVANWWLEDH